MVFTDRRFSSFVPERNNDHCGGKGARSVLSIVGSLINAEVIKSEKGFSRHLLFANGTSSSSSSLSPKAVSPRFLRILINSDPNSLDSSMVRTLNFTSSGTPSLFSSISGRERKLIIFSMPFSSRNLECASFLCHTLFSRDHRRMNSASMEPPPLSRLIVLVVFRFTESFFLRCKRFFLIWRGRKAADLIFSPRFTSSALSVA
mmetsp:Transcript_38598/g.74885  ORF Transcript_38598/g.74885 Transcript_38598/m.74885 type:complete len:203 (+) Transcript_38598:2428-3036(+)